MWPIAIVGHLKPGWEDAGTIAARLGRLFGSLAGIDPMFSRWRRLGARRHRSAVPAFITIPPEKAELRSWIEEGVVFGSREGHKKTVGYTISARTPAQNPIRADFWLSFEPEEWWFGHRIGITIFSSAGSQSVLDDPQQPPGPDRVAAPRASDHGNGLGLRLDGSNAGQLSAARRIAWTGACQVPERLDGLS
jgi:hypothetical protein